MARGEVAQSDVFVVITVVVIIVNHPQKYFPNDTYGGNPKGEPEV
jgi:hypothetical protein